MLRVPFAKLALAVLECQSVRAEDSPLEHAMVGKTGTPEWAKIPLKADGMSGRCDVPTAA